MQLTPADTRFVRSLAGPHAEDVLAVLSGRSQVLVAMGGGVKPTTLSADLGDWLRLVVRVVRSAFRGAPGSWDSVIVERTPKALAGRIEYVEEFRPAERLVGVTATTPLLWPGAGASARVLVALLRALLGADRERPSELTYRATNVATACLQALGYARRAKLDRAYLFRPYRLESPLAAAMLMNRGIEVDVIAGTTPIAAHISRMVASKGVLCTAYQLDEAKALRPLGPDGELELWGPTEIAVMERAYRGRPFDDLPDDIGVYTQGFWVRLLRGTIDAAEGEPHRDLEARFLSAVADYARAHPEVRIHMFAHPMERAWYREHGEHGYASLVDLPNVITAFDSDESSVLSFDRVGLGLTTVSTVGFDRLHLGLRTLFFVGESDFLDPTIVSPFQPLFLTSEEALRPAIERYRTMGHTTFMAEHFDDAYGGQWGPWEAGAPLVVGSRRQAEPRRGATRPDDIEETHS